MLVGRHTSHVLCRGVCPHQKKIFVNQIGRTMKNPWKYLSNLLCKEVNWLALTDWMAVTMTILSNRSIIKLEVWISLHNRLYSQSISQELYALNLFRKNCMLSIYYAKTSMLYPIRTQELLEHSIWTSSCGSNKKLELTFWLLTAVKNTTRTMLTRRYPYETYVIPCGNYADWYHCLGCYLCDTYVIPTWKVHHTLFIIWKSHSSESSGRANWVNQLGESSPRTLDLFDIGPDRHLMRPIV